ncbi:MAG TPA: tRNA pseudouridine(38-40) synthase TruA [Deltaproteobacteria bacterium]|nr:tRNA pseudouridine(38-40) synthase TruA [Deltaproteobacteria bacterium]
MADTRWRIDLEYDGAPFAGWQLQPNARTIQGEVEAALRALLGHPARVSAAGRTDAGVHAALQVATFVSSAPRAPRSIRDGLNAHLPPEIACTQALVVPDHFDPRRTPHVKVYRYAWLVRVPRSPLRRHRAWHVRTPLDLTAMQQAVACLVGTHDFSSFRASGCSARHPNRTLEGASVQAAGDELHLRLVGTGFLRHMVRIVAGSLYDVGRGHRRVEWIAELLAARDRGLAGKTAPPHGLLLEQITYRA